jgi:hypothetical protein
MVFKPNERARRLVENWRKECADPVYERTGDETPLQAAIMKSTGVTFCPMDIRYAAREVDSTPPDAVVVHASATHARSRALA